MSHVPRSWLRKREVSPSSIQRTKARIEGMRRTFRILSRKGLPPIRYSNRRYFPTRILYLTKKPTEAHPNRIVAWKPRGKIHYEPRLSVNQQQQRVFTILQGKPQTLKQIRRRMDLSTGRTKFYLVRVQRSTKVQRIGKYYHLVEKPQGPQEVAPEKKIAPWVMRAAFNSGSGPVNLEIDVVVPFWRDLSVHEDQDSELLRVRNRIEDVVRRKFGKQIVYSSNFRMAPVPSMSGESRTDRWRYRHQGGSWNEF